MDRVIPILAFLACIAVAAWLACVSLYLGWQLRIEEEKRDAEADKKSKREGIVEADRAYHKGYRDGWAYRNKRMGGSR